MKRTDRVILNKIVYYCDEIANDLARFGNDIESFRRDTSYQRSTTSCVTQIGELTNHLSQEFRENHPETHWRSIVCMRNIVVHDYERLDFVTVWDAITNDVPALKKSIKEILSKEGRGTSE
ncbi:MAG: DUF86 domain-containing protein [Thermoguttaceae bacterium]|nr:DUF86 domain-containing protein [Thermoguttaceae bacterium]